METVLLPLVVKYPVCIEGLSEDDIRALAKALQAQADVDVLNGFVQAPAAARVKFAFDATGNFNGITAIIDGKPVTLFGGVGSQALGIFKGPPTADNPGPGWFLEADLTKEFFHQSDLESEWKIFLASREQILNTVVSS